MLNIYANGHAIPPSVILITHRSVSTANLGLRTSDLGLL